MNIKPKPDWHAEAQRMRMDGVRTNEIAQALGKSLRQVQTAVKGCVGAPDLMQAYRDRPCRSGRSRKKVEGIDQRTRAQKVLVNAPFVKKHSDDPTHALTSVDRRRMHIAKLVASDSIHRNKSISLPRLRFLEEAA